MVVQLVVASIATVGGFGEFALASTTILFLLGAGRAVIAQTDVLRGRPGHDQSPINAAYLIAGVTLGVGGILALLGMVEATGMLTTLGTATACSSVFILQDSARFRCFRMRRSKISFGSDLVVLAAALIGLYLIRDSENIAQNAVLVWSVATFLGLIVVAIPIRYFPRRPVQMGWLASQKDLVGPSSGEYLLQSGLPYLLNWVFVAVGGYDALAGYRLIQLLFAVVSNLAQGLNAVTLPRIVDSRSPFIARATMRFEFVVLLAIAAMALFTLFLLPDSWGEFAFGETWIALGVFLLPGALHGATNALLFSNFSLLRLLGYAKYSFLVGVWSTLAAVVLVSIGVLLWGAVGAAWAMAIVAVGGYVVRLVRTSRELRFLTSNCIEIPDRSPKTNIEQEALND